MFRASVIVQVGDGASARWTDAWLPGSAICCFAPSLFRAVGSRRRNRSIKDALDNRQWASDITGALTAAVLCDLQLWDMVDDFQLQPHVPDRFIWKWTANSEYLAYRTFFVGMTSLVGAMDVWRSSVPPKVKFFFWLALHGRLWTAERRRRHGLPQAWLGIACWGELAANT
jgi:hypothetical protein